MTSENADFNPPEPHAAGAGSSPFIRRIHQLEKDLEQSKAQLKQVQRQKAHGKKKWHFTPQSSEADNEEGWLTTYLDTMTLLLVLLVVMLAFSGNGIVQSVAERSSKTAPTAIAQRSDAATESPPSTPINNDARALLDGLPMDKLGQNIDVIVNEKSVSFRINSEILFSSGQADLSLEGLAVLRQLIPVLKASTHTITVEGHTDAVPIRSARYPSNWELSGSRAGSVVRYLESNGIDSRRLKAVGYADTRPLADNSTAEGRASNRRVELILEATDPKGK
jgi:chemotaxis protein MotB